jgi:hypothetical protein
MLGLAITFLASGCSTKRDWKRRAKITPDHEQAQVAVQELGGEVDFSLATPDRSATVVVRLTRLGAPAVGTCLGRLDRITDFPGILYLNDSEAADSDLAPLKAWTRLQGLNLSQTRVTDAGLVHLKGLTNLRWLLLARDRVTDAGLVHLGGLTSLRDLVLSSTFITDASLVSLKGLSNLITLDLARTQITDRGLKHLTGFTALEELKLTGTSVTDAGVRDLQEALPQLRVIR